ncbi:MAG: sialidase family protein [Spirochaetaceae bacterium]|nr:sialidase family protein [Spirochaetaceae bacterium]
MRVIDGGVVFEAASADGGRTCTCFTGVRALGDGTVLVTFRQASARKSADGSMVLYASRDGGATWQRRYDTRGADDWAGTPGEVYSFSLREEPDGALTATGLWIDRSGPERPFSHPRTSGLLPMRIFHTRSTDAGASWSPWRRMETPPHVAASPCSMPVLDLAGGVRAQPYECWKEYEDPAPAPQAAYLRLSHDGGATWPDHVQVARDRSGGRFYWDQRLAVHPETGRLVAMFWTHDARAGRPLDVHIAWGEPDGGGWTEPVGTGITGNHTQPLAVGGDRLLAFYPTRGAGRDALRAIMAAESHDFGRTWDAASRTVVYRSEHDEEAGSRAAARCWARGAT